MTAVPHADRAVESLRRLHRAQRVITSDLTLSTMLTRVVHTAAEVVGANHAALAMLSADGSLEVLVQMGLDDDAAARLHKLPNDSQLAALKQQWPPSSAIAHPRDAAARPSPGSTRFLRAAVAAGDEHIGDLYLAQPPGSPFTDGDRELMDALSRSAGSAIAHARSLDRERRSTEWLHASGEVARALLAEADVDMVGEVVARAVSAAGADYGQIVIPTDDGDIEVIATAGLGAQDLLGVVFDPQLSVLGTVVIEGSVLRTTDVSELLSDAFDNRHRYGPVMVTPLIDAKGVRGAIMLARIQGKPAFADYELDLFATYAAQVALAMQFADARVDTERLQLLDIRHRTARELHDIVMQRLFATGVGLNSIADQIVDAAQAQQLRRYVRELDETIDEIRERVFGARGDAQAVLPTRSRFPRIAGRTAGDAVANADTDSTTIRSVRPMPRRPGRGRRRTDWQDGTGTQQH